MQNDQVWWCIFNIFQVAEWAGFANQVPETAELNFIKMLMEMYIS